MKFLLASLAGVVAIDNGFTKPPRGWSALYGAPFNSVNETIMATAAAALQSSGLAKFGYEYVVLDDWYTIRDANGTIKGDPKNFPSGMAALSEKVHAAGIKFGVYSAASMETCGGRAASLFNEQNDADQFANVWKIDYLKYDSCIGSVRVSNRVRYQAMGRALNATGRQIYYSVEGWSPDENDALWAPDLANQWRTGSDIWPNWDNKPNCILNNLYQTNNAAKFHFVGKGFNDPDMLQPPNTLKTVLSPGLAPEEAYSQYKLWVIMKSPLVLGTNWEQVADLQKLEPKYYAMLTNTELLAINEDMSEQAIVRGQFPSRAQQIDPLGLNVTMQNCDSTRLDQRFAVMDSKVMLVGTSLCLTDDAQGVWLKPCAAVKTTWTLPETETVSMGVSSTSANCMEANLGQYKPVTNKCIYNGTLPPPLDANMGSQLWIFGKTTQQILGGSEGQCLTAGLLNLDPSQHGWTTNNGTLDHEVWMGDLTPDAAGKARRVVALFNKGKDTDALTAPADLIGTVATGATVRDAELKVDLPAISAGGDLTANVLSHGVKVYVLTY